MKKEKAVKMADKYLLKFKELNIPAKYAVAMKEAYIAGIMESQKAKRIK